MHIAVAMICRLHNTEAAPAMCRSVLGLDNGAAQDRLDFRVRTRLGHTFFHGLAVNVGIANQTEMAGEWHSLAHDVLKNLGDIRDLSQPGPKYYYRKDEPSWKIMTPLLSLISECMRILMFPYQQHVPIKMTNSAAVLASCEKSIFAWLSDLYEAGVDLVIYGRNEKRHLRDPNVLPDGMNDSYFCWTDSHGSFVDIIYLVRLIDFRYGRLPTDWKFYWSEPSDQFAGDFWSLVEWDCQEAAMGVPGAWVD